MSTTLITKTITKDGVLTSPDSVILRDAANVYGVKRTDTDAVVVASGQAMTEVSAGIFQWSFTDPAYNLTYAYAVEITDDTRVIRFVGEIAGSRTPGEALKLISLARAQESANLAALTTYTLIEVASDWIDSNWVVGPYTVDGSGISENVDPRVQQATILMMGHLLHDESSPSGSVKKSRRKEKLGDYELETELGAENRAGVAVFYRDVLTMMIGYPRKPLRRQPVIFTSDYPEGT